MCGFSLTWCHATTNTQLQTNDLDALVWVIVPAFKTKEYIMMEAITW